MTDDIDIVDRLRIVWTSASDRVNAERSEAADEIERLRSQVVSVADELVAARAEIEQLNIQHRAAEPLLNELWERRTEATEMRAEIERLRAGGCARDQKTTQYCAEAARLQAERDEARLAYCREVLVLYGDADEQYRLEPSEVARRKGWHNLSEILTGSTNRAPNIGGRAPNIGGRAPNISPNQTPNSSEMPNG